MHRTLSVCLALTTALAAACGTYVPMLDEDGGADAASLDAGGDAGPDGDGGVTAMLAIDVGDNDFGDVLQGASSAAASFVISNHGGVASGTLTTALDGDADDFTLTSDGCGGTVLQPEASCTIEATFAPGTTGELAATLRVTGDPGGEVGAELSGRALAPGALTVDDDSHDYGDVKVAAMSPARSFTFTNTGDVDTGALAVALSNPAFTVGSDSCTGEILVPADTCTVTVRFAPDSVGSATGSLTVSADPGGNSVVALGGDGYAIVTVTRSGSGAGAVTSTPAGIICGAVCQLSFTTPSVTLTAAADAGNTFAGWTGDCSGTGACTLDLNGGDAAMIARFEAIRELTVDLAGNGGGSVSSVPAGISCGGDCSQTYLHGTSITLTAAPTAGSQLAGWTGCDSSTGSTCTVAMNAARAVTATFNLQTFGVAVNKTGAGGGTITSTPAGIACGGDCSQTWSYGTVVELTAVAGAGSTFVGWDGCDSVAGATCTITVDGARSIDADFDLQTHTLTASRTGTGNGSISSTPGGIACPGDCSESYLHGTSVTLTATAAAGSSFTGWTGCDTATGSTCVVAVDGAESVSAGFALQSFTVTVTRTGGGTGAVASTPAGIACPGDCSQSWTYNTAVTLTATPEAGSVFAGWTGCDSATGTTCTLTVNGAENVSAAFEPEGYTVGVTRTGTGNGTVTSNPAGIACPGDCSSSFASGTPLTLTASAATGSAFAGWTGCDSTSGATCTLTVNGTENVTAVFNLTSHVVTVATGGAGSGTVTSTPAGIACPGDCTQSWTYGTPITLTAAAATGSTFAGWTGCDSTSGATCAVTVNGAENVTASFDLTTPTLTVNTSGNGTVTSSPAGIACPGDCSQSYTYDTSVTLTATPSTGSVLASWSNCDTVSGNTCTVAMTAARTVTAAFNPTTHVVTVSRAGNGDGTITSSPAGISCPGDCDQTWSYGQSVTLTATPATGSTLTTWTGCDTLSGNTCTVTVNGAENVTATFTLQTYTVTVSKDGNGSGTVTSNPGGISCNPDCTQTWTYGQVVNLGAAATTGSTLTGWAGCDSVSGGCTITVTGNRTVTATFTLTTHTLTVTKAGTGVGTVTSTPAGISCPGDCTQTWNYGQVVSLSAAPAAGSVFAGWSGACAGTGACSVTMDAAKSVTATFNPQPKTLTVTVSNGSGDGGTATGRVTATGINCGFGGSDCSETYSSNTTVTLSRSQTGLCSSFVGWGGACSGTGTSCTVTVSGPVSVTAGWAWTCQ